MAFRPEPFFLPFLFLYKSASTVIFPFSPFLVILYPILNCPPLRDILSLPRSLSLSSIMTPLYQQPPFVDQKDEDQRLKLFGFSSNQASSSLSWAAYLNTGRDQRGCGVEDHPSRQILHDDPKVSDSFFFGASTDRMVISSPSSSLPPEVCEEKTTVVSGNGEEDHSSKRELNGSLKWMSSKMRIMQKMVNKEAEARQDFGNPQYQKSGMNSSSSNNNNNTIRVCSDCKTTTTPLWRSGPQGPKSLCNACGIRQRKARRAMAEAAGATANSTVVSSDSPSLKQNKEKKSRTTSHVGQNKAKFKLPDSVNGERKLSFNNIALSLSETSAFERVFPRDEEEGAILLMELSCGFVHG